MHRLDLGLYSHPKQFLGNGVRTHVNSKEKKTLNRKKILLRGGSNPRCCIKQDSERNTLPTSYSDPRWCFRKPGNEGCRNDNNNRIQRRYLKYFTISSQRRELSPTRTLKWPRRNRVQITCNTSSAYHVQHVVLRATWYEGTAQLLSLTELKSHLF